MRPQRSCDADGPSWVSFAAGPSGQADTFHGALHFLTCYFLFSGPQCVPVSPPCLLPSRLVDKNSRPYPSRRRPFPLSRCILLRCFTLPLFFPASAPLSFKLPCLFFVLVGAGGWAGFHGTAFCSPPQSALPAVPSPVVCYRLLLF